jgi:peptide/nickel transport system substrate-binding protein
MKFTAWQLLALSSLCFLATASPAASTRPRYGGTLRIELHETTVSLDPREWAAGSPQSAANEKLAALVFDRLVTLDDYGQIQPQLANYWSHDAAMKHWQFVLRPGVKFSDGSLLSAADVVAALHPLLPAGLQIAASSSVVTIQSGSAVPDLLEQLASGRHFIYRVQPDGGLLGTGTFVAADSAGNASNAEPSTSAEPSAPPHAPGAAKHFHFRANEEAWSGRPFVDAIDVTLGVLALRQFFDLQLGRADLVELSPELARRAAQENIHVWTSALVTLVALRFVEAQPAADPRLREALSLSLDRGTMSGVLLQRQAQPASALLPQWLSGYAFLFTMETNLTRAREIRASLPATVATIATPLRLYVDEPGDLAKLIAERVAVNARQSSIIIQVIHHSSRIADSSHAASTNDSAPALHLFTWRYSSLSPRAELDAIVFASEHTANTERSTSSTDVDQIYSSERRVLDARGILPLVALPEFVGLGANVRNWMPSRWGEWRLGDVWLDVRDAAATPTGVPPSLQLVPQPPQALVPGAHP